MKSIVFTPHTWLTAAMFMLLAACSNSTQQPGFTIDPDTDPATQAATMARQFGPARSAELFVDWLCEARLGQRPFAATLTTQLAAAYDTGGASNRFLNALDSVAMTCDRPTQAHIFAVGSIPESLAATLRQQNADTAFVALVAEAYRPDSALYCRFMHAVNKQ